jgi:hypothetical protein
VRRGEEEKEDERAERSRRKEYGFVIASSCLVPIDLARTVVGDVLVG